MDTIPERSLPVALIAASGIFFGAYLFVIASAVSNLANRGPGFPALIFGLPGSFSFLTAHFILGLFFLVSFAGSVLLVRIVKRRSPRWHFALPLCILEGAAAVSVLLFSNPFTGHLIGLGHLFLVLTLVIPLLPFVSALAFISLQGTSGKTLTGSMILATGIGGSGILLFLLSCLWFPRMTPLLGSYQDSPVSFAYPGPLLLAYLFFLLPVPGLLLIRLGFKVANGSRTNDITSGKVLP